MNAFQRASANLGNWYAGYASAGRAAHQQYAALRDQRLSAAAAYAGPIYRTLADTAAPFARAAGQAALNVGFGHSLGTFAQALGHGVMRALTYGAPPPPPMAAIMPGGPIIEEVN